MKRITSLLITACLAAALLSGCGGSGGSQPSPSASPAPSGTSQGGTSGSDRYGGILRVNDTGDKAVLGYPAQISSGSILRHVAPVIETILRYDSEGNPTPYLAESCDPDPEALTITMAVREGILFHDGTTLDAEAVKWNFEEQMNAGITAFANVESIEVTGSNTLVLHLSKWDNTFLSQLCSYPGMMISPTACQENGTEWAVNNPVGTGPFKFVSWEKDVEIVFEKFDGYWQEGLPYLDGITLTFTADDTSREFSLRNGDVDVLIQGSVANIVNLVKDGYAEYAVPVGTGGVCLIPDSANSASPWADVKVRQAAAHAVEAQLIVDSILQGHGTVTNQYSYPGHWGYSPDVAGYDYNLETAKQLLSDAGYPDGFSSKLVYNADSDDADLIATALQSMLAEVGINLTLEPYQNARFTEMERQGGGWEGLMQIGGNPNPDTAEQMKVRLWGGGSWLVSMDHPEALQTAIDEAVAAAEFEDKQALVWQAQEILVDEQCLIIPLLVTNDTSIASPKVHDTGISAGLPAVGWTPETAWLEK